MSLRDPLSETYRENIVSKILFLDIDGVVLPNRAYKLPTQTKPIVSVFDPCSVALLNDSVKRSNRKIVIHSSWIRTKFLDSIHGGDVVGHCINQGIKPWLFHEDTYCDRDTSWRYDRVLMWLAAHPEVTEYVVLDDEPTGDVNHKCNDHHICTDADEGITMDVYNKICSGYFPR